MADLKTLFSEEAAQCRRLAEIATEQGIKEKLLEMAARFQALADGDNEREPAERRAVKRTALRRASAGSQAGRSGERASVAPGLEQGPL